LKQTDIRSFSRETLYAYRDYIKDEKSAEKLHNILTKIRSKGYKTAEPKYKRVPREFDDDFIYSDLARYDSMYAYKEIEPNDILFSQKLVDYAYDIYEDMLELQQWVYEMTLTIETDTI
jgi:hypothetical protein